MNSSVNGFFVLNNMARIIFGGTSDNAIMGYLNLISIIALSKISRMVAAESFCCPKFLRTIPARSTVNSTALGKEAIVAKSYIIN
jgi:hypothetical protein